MTTTTVTVSDVIPAAAPAAAARGTAPVPTESAARVQAGGRDGRANARARVPATDSVGKRIRTDLSHSWVWREVPPSLKQIVESRVPDLDRVPSGSRPARAVWVVWNYGVAIPSTAVLYILAWILQHPARAAVLAVIAGPLGILWITN